MAKHRPFGVSVISVIIIIQAILALLLAAVIAVGGTLISKLNIEGIAALGPIAMVVALFIGLIAIFQLILAFALRKGKQWARIFIIIVNSISIIMSIVTFAFLSVFSLVSLVINVIIVGYLLFDKDAKKFFR